MTKLATPKITITLENPGTNDTTEYVVQTDNRDLVAFDLTRNRKGWPIYSEAEFLWMSFIGWHALSKRGGVAVTLDDFFERCISAVPLDENDEETSAAAAANGAVSAESLPQEAEPIYAQPSHSV